MCIQFHVSTATANISLWVTAAFVVRMELYVFISYLSSRNSSGDVCPNIISWYQGNITKYQSCAKKGNYSNLTQTPVFYAKYVLSLFVIVLRKKGEVVKYFGCNIDLQSLAISHYRLCTYPYKYQFSHDFIFGNESVIFHCNYGCSYIPLVFWIRTSNNIIVWFHFIFCYVTYSSLIQVIISYLEEMPERTVMHF